jgi:glucose 1-dehydrogenase
MIQSNGWLTGRVAIVTGASSGIGAQCARRLAAEGASVVVNYPPFEKETPAVVAEIGDSGGTATAIAADVSVEEDVQRMFRQTCDRFGTVDILVNNAGIQDDAAFHDMTLDQWNNVIGVNLTGFFLCAREAIRIFRQRTPTPERHTVGTIVTMSSVHQHIPWAGHANYATSKGGMMLLMKTIAQEYAPHGIRVNAVAPGAIQTPINESVWSDPEGRADMLRLIPQGRIGDTEDVARVVAWLAADESDYITGTTVVVDGGMLLYPGFRTGG